MKKLEITIATWDYDRVRPIMGGRVRVEGCEINFIKVPPEECFHRAWYNQDFDVTEIGLSGYIIATSRGTGIGGESRRIEVGMVGVNIGVAASPAYFPFSGWKDSFFGDLHVHGWDAVEFFTRKKTVTSRYFSVGETGKFFVEQGDKH
jgi:hypothetical protein